MMSTDTFSIAGTTSLGCVLRNGSRCAPRRAAPSLSCCGCGVNATGRYCTGDATTGTYGVARCSWWIRQGVSGGVLNCWTSTDCLMTDAGAILKRLRGAATLCDQDIGLECKGVLSICCFVLAVVTLCKIAGRSMAGLRAADADCVVSGDGVLSGDCVMSGGEKSEQWEVAPFNTSPCRHLRCCDSVFTESCAWTAVCWTDGLARGAFFVGSVVAKKPAFHFASLRLLVSSYESLSMIAPALFL